MGSFWFTAPTQNATRQQKTEPAGLVEAKAMLQHQAVVLHGRSGLGQGDPTMELVGQVNPQLFKKAASDDIEYHRFKIDR